jgi:predicted HTH transcriptional regulator
MGNFRRSSEALRSVAATRMFGMPGPSPYGAATCRLERKMERERVMLAVLPELSVLILELAPEHSRVTVAEAARVSGASRNTVKDHLKALVEQGHLTLHGAGRGAWYRLA